MTGVGGLLEAPDAGPPPRRHGRPGRGRAAVVVALVVASVLAALTFLGGGGLVRGLLAGPADYPGPGEGSVSVEVPSGASVTTIGEVLAARGVVRSAGAFTEAAEDDPRARRLQPGFYRLRQRMRGRDALALMLDPASRLRSRFTLPEGTSLGRTLEIISSSVDAIPLPALKRAAANPAALGLPSYAGGKLEGFLFPATYDVEPGSSPVQVLTMLVDRFKEAAAEVGLEDGAARLGRTPREMVTVASLVEAETPKADQRGKVSRVVFNRLAAGQALQFDSTVKYVFAQRGVAKKRILLADLKVDSPYNTYRHTGLPPGPINSPGVAALRAALDPTPGPWLYFVVIDKEGNSAFTDSYEEFLRLRRRYRREVLGEG